jgi:hypothetical protein
MPKKDNESSSLGKLTFSLGELAKPFRLGGTLAEPSLALDPTQSAITLGKSIGGTILFGPLGVAAALVGKKTDDENPCLSAIEAAKKGVKLSKEEKPMDKKREEEKPAENGSGGIKNAIDGIGKKLKSLFGE